MPRPYQQRRPAISAAIYDAVRRIYKDENKMADLANFASMDKALLQHFAETDDRAGITAEHLDKLAEYFQFKLRNCDTFKDEPSYLDIEATAYHEAAHAVAAWRCGVTLSDDNEIVITWSAKELNPSGSAINVRFDIETDKFATILLAGPLAECKFRGLKAHALTGNRNCRGSVKEIRFGIDADLGAFLESLTADRNPGSSQAGCNWRATMPFKCGNCGSEFIADVSTSHAEGDINQLLVKKPSSEDLLSFVAATRTLLDDESIWTRIVALATQLHALRFRKWINGTMARSIIEDAVP